MPLFSPRQSYRFQQHIPHVKLSVGHPASAEVLCRHQSSLSIYTAMIAFGVLIILLPVNSLVQAMMISQTMNGLLLPIILIAMLRLINNKRLMGRFVNGKLFNLLAWITVVVLILLAVFLIIATLLPSLISF